MLTYKHYFKHNIYYIIIPLLRGVKCASYAIKEIKYVNVTQSSLDCTQEEKKIAINKDLQKLVKIIVRLKRNYHKLELAKKRVKVKIICLLDKLEEEKEAQQVKNSGLTNGKLEELSYSLITYNNITENNGQEVQSVQNLNNLASPSNGLAIEANLSSQRILRNQGSILQVRLCSSL